MSQEEKIPTWAKELTRKMDEMCEDVGEEIRMINQRQEEAFEGHKYQLQRHNETLRQLELQFWQLA